MRAVLLTGPPASGKTTVAKRLQRLLREPWLFFEVDRTQPRLPPFDEVVTVANERRMVAANLRAARAYVDAGFSRRTQISSNGQTNERRMTLLRASLPGSTESLTRTHNLVEGRP